MVESVLTDNTRNAFCDSIATNATDRMELTYPGTGDLGEWDGRVRSYHCLGKK
jgi:hypothetical protein